MTMHALARSVYRDLWRASRFTFHGDTTVLNAFREKMRTDAASWKEITDSATLQQALQQGRDVAQFLRRNVVQAHRAPEKDADGNDIYRVTLNEHSERGDNNFNRGPKPEPPEVSSRRQRKSEKKCCQSELTEASGPSIPRNFSQLKRAHKERKVPELKEEDLEEKFVRGSGPGGQSINKTQNNVQLLHKPTGIRVACQETRSLETNRMLARRVLREKLDRIANPGLSKGELNAAKQRERERQKRKKAKKKTLYDRKKIEGEKNNANAD